VGLIFAAIGAGLTIAGERVVDNAVFSAVVIMVALTTLVTPPLLVWRLRQLDGAGRARKTPPGAKNKSGRAQRPGSPPDHAAKRVGSVLVFAPVPASLSLGHVGLTLLLPLPRRSAVRVPPVLARHIADGGRHVAGAHHRERSAIGAGAVPV